MLILRRPWDSQPQGAVWLRADLNPISGFNPAAGLVDTQGQSFTVSVTPDRLVNRFGIETDFVQASSESLMRTVSVPQWPMTFVAVFRHQAGDGGIGYLGAVATSGDKTNRVYVSGGTVAAQHIGGTTNAAATSPAFLSFGVTGVVVAVFKSATDLTVYYSGNVARGKVQTTTNVGAATTLTKLAYGVYDGSVLTRYLDGGLNFSAWFASAFDESLANAVLENPWPLFGAQSILIPVSAGDGVSGTLATTNANDTSSASGTTTVTGTVARTNANDTSAASGTTTIVGTLATTNANDTSAASGSVGGDVTGTVAYTNANDTVSASGTTTVTGTLARTNADDSAAASGWAGAVTGTLAYTNANDTADASGIAETGFLAGIGGWGPIRRRKRKDEDEDKPQELPEVVEVVATKPRKTLKLADIIGKRQAAQITSVDLSEAVAASKKRKRRQEDELLLLM